jgi:hypothetical protein
VTFASNAEFIAALEGLIDTWCDRRALKTLAYVLPAYKALNGMTDGWGELLIALKNVRGLCRDELSDPELDLVGDLVRAADTIVNRRQR